MGTTVLLITSAVLHRVDLPSVTAWCEGNLNLTLGQCVG